jgi:hypothetical protein
MPERAITVRLPERIEETVLKEGEALLLRLPVSPTEELLKALERDLPDALRGRIMVLGPEVQATVVSVEEV